MKLSACLVTRNEEAFLPRALRSLDGIADEIIVVDTGSKDQSLELARSLGAKVWLETWRDDFSVARNVALDQVTSDWILWINPDEEVLAESRDSIRQAITRKDALGYYVSIRNLPGEPGVSPPGDNADIFSVHEELRLFRRLPDIRYVGRLHPSFVNPLEIIASQQKSQVFQTNITLCRHAYHSELTRGKLRWAVRLLEMELADRPGQLHYLIEYGRHLLWLNDSRGHSVLAEAVERLKPFLENEVAPTTTVGSLLEYILTVAPEQCRATITVAEACRLASVWFAHSPPMVWHLAQYYFTRGDYLRAALQLEKLVQFAKTGFYDRSAAFDSSILGDAVLMNLGICCLRLGRLEHAAQYFRTLLTNAKLHSQASENLELVEQLVAKSSKTADPS